MKEFVVQVTAKLTVTRDVTVRARSEKAARAEALNIIENFPPSCLWNVPGEKDYIGVRVDMSELDDFDTDEVTVST